MGRVINLFPNLVNHLPFTTHYAAINTVDDDFYSPGIPGANGNPVLAGPIVALARLENALKSLDIIYQNLNPRGLFDLQLDVDSTVNNRGRGIGGGEGLAYGWGEASLWVAVRPRLRLGHPLRVF